MKLTTKLALSTALVAGIAIGGTALSSNNPSQYTDGSHVYRQSVIKVHTDHGVITLPGSAKSWDAVENAVFVADSIADVQVVNNEIPWRIANE